MKLPLKFYQAKKGERILVIGVVGNKLYECIDDNYKFKNGASMEVMWLDEVEETNDRA